MAKDHYLPLFVGDFLASTATWSGPERGLYLQLLMLQWGAKKLPKDLLKLSRSVGYTKSEFEDLWPAMSDKFEELDGFLLNPRLEEIRNRNTQIQEARRIAGQRGADARWHSKGNAIANGKGNGKGNGKIMPSEPNRNRSESVSETQGLGRDERPFSELSPSEQAVALQRGFDKQERMARRIGFRDPLPNESLDSYRVKVAEAQEHGPSRRGNGGGPVSARDLLR